MTTGIRNVERFAKALDSEEYAVAESMLSDECTYKCRGELHHGPSAIIASYRDHGAAAASFDAVEYESEVVGEANGGYRIRFTDRLTHGGRRLTFRCDQLIDVDESGRIVRIEHVDLPGQLEALADFKKVCVDHN